MTDFNFDIVERYDDELAREGRDFDVYAENGKKMGTFDCAYYSFENSKVKLTQERVRRAYAKDLRVKGNDDPETNLKIVREVFIEAALLGWKDITAGGKEVPFSKEAAKAYFALPAHSYVFNELLRECMDPMNFQAEDKEEVLGN